MGFLFVWILLLHEFMTGTHAVELTLSVDHWNEHRIVFTRVDIQVVVGLGHTGSGDFPAA